MTTANPFKAAIIDKELCAIALNVNDFKIRGDVNAMKAMKKRRTHYGTVWKFAVDTISMDNMIWKNGFQLSVSGILISAKNIQKFQRVPKRTSRNTLGLQMNKSDNRLHVFIRELSFSININHGDLFCIIFTKACYICIILGKSESPEGSFYLQRFFR